MSDSRMKQKGKIESTKCSASSIQWTTQKEQSIQIINCTEEEKEEEEEEEEEKVVLNQIFNLTVQKKKLKKRKTNLRNK